MRLLFPGAPLSHYHVREGRFDHPLIAPRQHGVLGRDGRRPQGSAEQQPCVSSATATPTACPAFFCRDDGVWRAAAWSRRPRVLGDDGRPVCVPRLRAP